MKEFKKVCSRCNTEYDQSNYKKYESSVCNTCLEKTQLKRMERYSSIDLGIDGLDHSKDKIKCISNNTKYVYAIELDKAIEMVLEGKASVYEPDTIYVTDDKSSTLRDRYRKIIKRSNFTCHYCGEYGDTVDHIIPKSLGGSNESSNLVCSCIDCNEAKASIDYNMFRKALNKYGVNNGKEALRKIRRKGGVYDLMELYKFDPVIFYEYGVGERRKRLEKINEDIFKQFKPDKNETKDNDFESKIFKALNKPRY